MPDLSFGEVGEILHLLQEVECAEIDLEWGDLKIQVRKAGSSPQATTAQQQAASLASNNELPARETAAVPAPARPDVLEGAVEAPDGDAEVPSNWSSVRAPMAGTFYRSPSPNEPAFVEVGAPVEAGETVALIEVMKLFTELKAEVAGKVARIDVPDGSLVEFDQALVWIEPV